MSKEPSPPAGNLRASPEQAERLHRYAHDLRNRLVGLRQAMHHLARPEAGVDKEELQQFGERQFFKALRETEQLMDDLGIDRGPGRVQATEVDLASLVRTALADTEHRFENKDQQVALETPDHLMVYGDTDLLRELVAGLLGNASKFTGRKETIQVTLLTDGPYAELRVSDPGVGLSRADLEQVFVRYAWLSSTSTEGEPQGRSTLSRARQWAKAMGGSLEASSGGPGNGSTFTLRLRLA